MAKYVLVKSLMAVAWVLSVNSTSIPCSTVPRCNKPGNTRALDLLSHDDAARVQVVVQGAAFAQKFGTEDQIVGTQGLACFSGEAHGHNGLNQHHRVWVGAHYAANNWLDALGVEVGGLGVIVGGLDDEHEVCAIVSLALVQRVPES